MHGSLDETPEDNICESQQLVIATKTLPFQDWKKTRIYASISEFLYFSLIFEFSDHQKKTPIKIIIKQKIINTFLFDKKKLFKDFFSISSIFISEYNYFFWLETFVLKHQP